MRKVTIVAGPPCAGKTTYVREHAQPGDLILDQDVIGSKAMGRELTRVRRMVDGTAWVIRCSPGPTARNNLARRLGADIVLLTPPRELLLARAKQRPHVRRTIAAITKWHNAEARDHIPTPGGRKNPRGNTTARGYDHGHKRLREALLPAAYGKPCPHCGELMLPGQELHLDHTPDRRGYRGMAHAGCNCADGAKRAHANRQSRGTVSREW